MDTNSILDVKNQLTQKYPDIKISEPGHLHVPVNQITEVMQGLRDYYGFNYLTNVTAVDYPDHMNVIYDLCKTSMPDMLHIIVKIDRQNPQIPSVFPIWGGALWQEREVYDLLGVVFTGHPDLRRILLDDTWEDHPLRKDFEWERSRV